MSHPGFWMRKFSFLVFRAIRVFILSSFRMIKGNLNTLDSKIRSKEKLLFKLYRFKEFCYLFFKQISMFSSVFT